MIGPLEDRAARFWSACASARCRHIPVVILSSSDAERDKADAARLGASRYIRKPSRLAEFLSLGAIFKAALTALSE